MQRAAALGKKYQGAQWEFKPINPMHNPEPYVEIQLHGDDLLMHPDTHSQASIACDVKGSNRYTDGVTPALLCQVGSFGSCFSALRSKMICAMEENFTSKGAPRMCEVKSFQPATHTNQQVAEKLAGSLFPLETFLRIHTWHTTIPRLASSTHWSSMSSMQGSLVLHGTLT